MPPPQRPFDRETVGGQQDDASRGSAGAGVRDTNGFTNRNDFGGFTSPNGIQYNRPAFATNGASVERPVGTSSGLDGQNNAPAVPMSDEDKTQRVEERADWEAARYSQNPLWDMFLLGGDVNSRMRTISNQEHLTDPQSGVLVNTQKTGPPPVARINGEQGSSRVIDKGQPVLDLHKGDRLSDLIKCVSLAAKVRMSGLLTTSCRTSTERRQHSKGRIPGGWEDMAVAVDNIPETPAVNGVQTATTSNPLKRKSFTLQPSARLTCTGTHDQSNDDESGDRIQSLPINRQVTIMSRAMAEEKIGEDARRAKRAKRKAATAAAEQTAAEAAEKQAVESVAGSGPEPKKSQKAAKVEKIKIREAQQHTTVNNAVSMALGGMMKKKSKYSWMSGGAGSGAATPKAGFSSPSQAGTPRLAEKAKPVAKEKQFAAWDEDKDPGVQARDVLLVLETDGQQTRSYMTGCMAQG